jgi:hypothetical protein
MSTEDELEMCEPCTDYAMWVDPGQGTYKQDDDGKCWSTNEAGSSNGLGLCREFYGFTSDSAPWIVSETVSCWFHEEDDVCYYENNGDCYSFDEAIEHYFGEEEAE